MILFNNFSFNTSAVRGNCSLSGHLLPKKNSRPKDHEFLRFYFRSGHLIRGFSASLSYHFSGILWRRVVHMVLATNPSTPESLRTFSLCSILSRPRLTLRLQIFRCRPSALPTRRHNEPTLPMDYGTPDRAVSLLSLPPEVFRLKVGQYRGAESSTICMPLITPPTETQRIVASYSHRANPESIGPLWIDQREFHNSSSTRIYRSNYLSL